MSITIDQVPCWIVNRGIGHAVTHSKDPGTYTACGWLLWGRYPSKSKNVRAKKPKRICAKCRKALEDINL